MPDLDLASKRARVVSTGGNTKWVFCQAGGAMLLPRLVAGRAHGPVFLAGCKPTRVVATVDLCLVTGWVWLSYRRAAEIFEHATWPLANSVDREQGWTLHQLRHAMPSHEAENGTRTPPPCSPAPGTPPCAPWSVTPDPVPKWSPPPTRPPLAEPDKAADMAFAAIHPEVGRIDATLPDLGRGLSWDQVHKTRPRVALRCPDCGYGVHAKVSARKLRYFAHDPGRPADCAWLNESLEHHLLKLELATAIRAADWHAELEVRAPDGTWRADVLASSHDGTQRIAWEAQLSPITNEEIQERTERYRAEGIGVCWVSPGGKALWLGAVPSVRVQEPREDRPWTVVDGPASFSFEHGTWIAVDDLELTAFIRWVLHGQTQVHRVRPRYRNVWFASRSWRRRPLVWTTSPHVDTETRHEAMRQRQEERKRQREEQERRAEQQRKAEAEARRIEEERQREAQRQEQERQRKIWEAEQAARWEEQQRQRAIEAEQARQRREAEERQRQEQARAAEEQRLRQEQHEQLVAGQWWAVLSPAQVQELRDAVAEPLWKKQATRAEFDAQGASADSAYGIAIYTRRRLHGILRPSPASLHRLPPVVLIYVRNAREAHQLTDTGNVDPGRVIHFNLPDHEQMSLI
ncbi:competence protein CoiA-like protein [Micromonospora pisi]|uniref:Competence protein CoiA-like protein n=1 Tax=Micromonospora pisi TaxID=589240 RepID=A0A495JHR3_9ACTN|nr:competence protein CoiA-like protein [Micromonospora pisi]